MLGDGVEGVALIWRNRLRTWLAHDALHLAECFTGMPTASNRVRRIAVGSLLASVVGGAHPNSAEENHGASADAAH
jgi:hypothetical protein